MLLVVWAVYIFKKSCSNVNLNVEYSPLNQLLNDGDDNYYRGSNFVDASLNDEEDDYELNSNDLRTFNGKIKTTKIIGDKDLETRTLLDAKL
jgi:hypothetical protein